MPTLMPHPLAYVFKRELIYVPFFGWAMGRMDMIHIDRSQRAQAFNKVVEQGKRLLAQGIWVIMFPEGTRIPRGQKGIYKTGGTRLAIATGAPVIPIAVTSAKVLAAQGLHQAPGIVDVSIGKPIPSEGREPDELMREVEAWIEARDAPARSRGLRATARQRRSVRGMRAAPKLAAHAVAAPAHSSTCSTQPQPPAPPRRARRASRPAPKPSHGRARRAARPGAGAARLPPSARQPRGACSATRWSPTNSGARAARNIGFIVGAEGLTVSAPRWVPLCEIDAAVQSKAALDPAQAATSARERAASASSRRASSGRTARRFPFLGEPVIVVLDPRHDFGEAGAVLQHRRRQRCPACRA